MHKILFITYFSANEPLLDTRTTSVLREMAKSGMEYHLVTFEKDAKVKGQIFEEREDLEKKFKSIGVKWHPLRYHKRPAILSTFYDICAGIFYCIFIVISKKIEYIHAQTSVGGAIAFFTSGLLRKKFVYDINGLLAEEYADIGTWKRNSFIFRLVSGFEKKIIYRANGIIPLSNRIARRIVSGGYTPYKKKNWIFQVIPSHVDTGRFNLNVSKNKSLQKKLGIEGKFVLIYIGSLGTWYMFPEMLDFFKEMKRVVSNAVFLILTHVDKEYVKKEIGLKQMDESDIIVTEALPSDIPDYLSLADAGISFIKPVFSKEACSPIKLGEYLASGMPVIINSNVGDTEVLVKKNNAGIVIESFEPSAYKTAIMGLKDLLSADGALGGRCRKTAKDFLSLEALLPRYRKFYKDSFGILL